jgi:hypothetical protein
MLAMLNLSVSSLVGCEELNFIFKMGKVKLHNYLVVPPEETVVSY